jgi:hypothetical protein
VGFQECWLVGFSSADSLEDHMGLATVKAKVDDWVWPGMLCGRRVPCAVVYCCGRLCFMQTGGSRLNMCVG